MKKFLIWALAVTALTAALGLSPLGRTVRPQVRAAMGPGSVAVTARSEIRYDFLWSLIGKSRDQVTKLLDEEPIRVTQGGLGFERTGVRVWFDNPARNAATRVGIVSAAIDLSGASVGGRLDAYEAAFGPSVWDNGEEAHFVWGGYFLVVSYYPPARTVSAAVIMDGVYYRGQYLPGLPGA